MTNFLLCFGILTHPTTRSTKFTKLLRMLDVGDACGNKANIKACLAFWYYRRLMGLEFGVYGLRISMYTDINQASGIG